MRKDEKITFKVAFAAYSTAIVVIVICVLLAEPLIQLNAVLAGVFVFSIYAVATWFSDERERARDWNYILGCQCLSGFLYSESDDERWVIIDLLITKMDDVTEECRKQGVLDSAEYPLATCYRASVDAGWRFGKFVAILVLPNDFQTTFGFVKNDQHKRREVRIFYNSRVFTVEGVPVVMKDIGETNDKERVYSIIGCEYLWHNRPMPVKKEDVGKLSLGPK